MGIDEKDFDRLVAGAVPTDDPQWGKVSAFLGDLEANCPPSSVSAVEEDHLSVVAREVRLVGTSRLRDHRQTVPSGVRTRFRRALAATGAAALFALTAGAGVAAALGVNPLQLLPDLILTPGTTPDAPASTTGPTGPSTADPTDSGPGTPTQPPATVPVRPSGTPTATHGATGNCGNGKGEGNASCTNGNSGKENPGKDNTAKANQGKSTSKPTPTPKATPSNKGKSGKSEATPTPTP